MALQARDHEDKTGERAECPDDFGVDPARVLMFVPLAGVGDVGAIEPNDSDCKDELNEADNQVGDKHRWRGA